MRCKGHILSTFVKKKLGNIYGKQKNIKQLLSFRCKQVGQSLCWKKMRIFSTAYSPTHRIRKVNMLLSIVKYVGQSAKFNLLFSFSCFYMIWKRRTENTFTQCNVETPDWDFSAACCPIQDDQLCLPPITVPAVTQVWCFSCTSNVFLSIPVNT